MRSEMPPLPEEWLRPTGDPEPEPNWQVLQHNVRQLGAVAENLNTRKGS